MPDAVSNNRRIARNTLFLYFRMLLIVLIGLYTSRVVLDVLGVEDYGVYNVVGGIVTVFGFVMGSMSLATQRFLGFRIGKGDGEGLKKVFRTSLMIHLVLAVLIVILSESAGFWLLENKMQIPPGRHDAAFWVLQFSVATCFFSVMSVPYNAMIIVNERMSAFAYISVFEAAAKLLVAFAISYSASDRLILYAFLLMVIQIIVRLVYGIYCRCHFREATRFSLACDKDIFKDMFAFGGWSYFGALASVGFTQGLNILLNVFYGPAVNAARAVSVQVQSVVAGFAVNFQTAINPQIIKSYAAGEFGYTCSLVFRSAKFSFFILYFLALPVILETDRLLGLWLKEVPEYSASFIKVMLVISLVDATSNSLMRLADATGRIRKYQTVVGTLLLMIVPVSYVLLKLFISDGISPVSVFAVHLVFALAAFAARLKIVSGLTGISAARYFREVLLPVVKVAAVSAVLPLLIVLLTGESVWRLVLVVSASAVSVAMSAYFLGLDSSEKDFVKSAAGKIFMRTGSAGKNG